MAKVSVSLLTRRVRKALSNGGWSPKYLVFINVYHVLSPFSWQQILPKKSLLVSWGKENKLWNWLAHHHPHPPPPASKVPRHTAPHKIQASPQPLAIHCGHAEPNPPVFCFKNDMRSGEVSWVMCIPLLQKCEIISSKWPKIPGLPTSVPHKQSATP